MNIHSLDWPAELELITFRRNSRSISTEDDCKPQLTYECNKLGILSEGTPTTVTVTMYNLTWLFKNKRDFVDLVSLFKKTKNDEIFATDLCVILVEHFWDQYYYKLLKVQFLPFVVYTISCSISIYLGVMPRDELLESKFTHHLQYGVFVPTTLLWVFEAYNEYI